MLRVTILSIANCPATPSTIKLVEEAASELDIAIDLSHVEVSTQEEADKHRFLGSPTVQVNGVDIDPSARSSTYYGVT